MRKLALFALGAAALLRAQDYALGPDSQPKDGVPKGTVTRNLRLEPGRYYPGTPHTYATYVPAKYDPAKPTAFMVFMDGSGAIGNQQRVNVVFDNLIAKGELPPMIGIFVDPGVLPALNDSAQSRFERIFEYDNMSDRFSNFLLEELIPEVGKKYNLSKNPDDRGLCGVSTGAVAAFVAAWHRPDQFHRVLSFIGTYVSMKGADAFPAMIRRTEPKPIRILLQDGKNDHILPGQEFGVFYAGSWPINNQLMYEALQFQGYDARLELGTGGHDMRQGSAMMPDWLRWLWRDYPQPIVVHEPAAVKTPNWESRGQVFAIVSADKPWEQVGAEYQNLAGPALDASGAAYFADRAHIYKAGTDGKVTVFRDGVSGITALRAGADSRLYASDLSKKRIVSYGPGGDEKVFASGLSANDFALTAKGEAYFVDAQSRSIGFIDSKGQKHSITTELLRPAAVSLTPDQAMLLAGDADSRFSWSFQIGKDGIPVNGEPFYRLDLPETAAGSGVSSVTVDSTGQPYFADSLGIQMCEQNGRCGAILNKPERGTLRGIAFTSAKDGNWLYAAENGKIFRRPSKRSGVTAATPVKPPKPAL